MNEKMFQSFLIFLLVIIIFLLMWTFPLSAEQVVRGIILSKKTLKPIDSVRVACFPEGTITYSDSDGIFTIPLCGVQYTDLQRKQHISTKNSGSSDLVSMFDQPHYQIFNIKGRRMESFALYEQSPVVKPRNRTTGIYILKSSTHSSQKVLVTNRTFLVPKLKKTEKRRTIQSSRNSSIPTVSFFKYGYQTAYIPVTEMYDSYPLLLHKKRWVASDIHNHSVLTDGELTFDELAAYAFTEGGLGVLINSEHGGGWVRDSAGRYFSQYPVNDPDYPQFAKSGMIPRWYTLIKYSWPKVVGQRKLYPDKIILQGLEWNCPGHDHASIGFINDEDQPEAVAQFEYRFDRHDMDSSRPELVKNNTTHDDALIGLKWLNDNYPTSSYFFLNHPSRIPWTDYPIHKIRDMIAAASEVCMGFEGMPGHQKYVVRGMYIAGDDACTYGGADPMLAQIGGKWDALLSEGHNFWAITNSDFHTRQEDFLPGEYSKTWSVVTGRGGAQAWLDGIRSGEIFIVNGNLISALEFYIDNGYSTASMGDNFFTKIKELIVVIRFKSETENKRGNLIVVDHIDVITGTISGKISPLYSELYTNPKAASTRIYSRFFSDSWIMENGWNTIRCTVNVEQPTYFRLRGTNLAVNTPGELDEIGNPLPDRSGANSAEVAWNDLWFYSNPIFVYPAE